MHPKIRDYSLVISLVVCVAVSSFGAIRAHDAAASARSLASEAVVANARAKTVGSTLVEIEGDVHPKPEPTVVEGLKHFTYSCATSAMQAECTLTNTKQTLLRVCLKGVIKRANSSATTESVVVCTGEVRPKETKTVSAPFPVGAVRSLCPGDYGGVKWDDCSFEMLDVTELLTKS